MRLKNKVAIITGSAQGIGLATAKLFCEEGAVAVIVDLDAALVEKAAQDLAGSGQALGLQADVTRAEDCERVVAAVLKEFGRLDVLVNNAGIAKDNLMMRMTEEQWDLVLKVNLKGAFHFTKAAAAPMQEARSGRIINITSLIGQRGNAGQANYAASKGGLIAFTKSCAREFAASNVLVNAVAPGFVLTRMSLAVPEDIRAKFAATIPLGRIADPVDIARAVLFLASEDSSYITGHVLDVNGGVSMG